MDFEREKIIATGTRLTARETRRKWIYFDGISRSGKYSTPPSRRVFSIYRAKHRDVSNMNCNREWNTVMQLRTKRSDKLTASYPGERVASFRRRDVIGPREQTEIYSNGLQGESLNRELLTRAFIITISFVTKRWKNSTIVRSKRVPAE